MNKKSLIYLFIAGFMFVSFSISASDKGNAKANAMPENVKTIIEKSCFGCHNTDSKNDKAKEDLDFKTFDKLSKMEMIHALKEIDKVVGKDEMPPEKFLARFPDKKLTEDEKTVLLNWAKSEAKLLME